MRYQVIINGKLVIDTEDSLSAGSCFNRALDNAEVDLGVNLTAELRDNEERKFVKLTIESGSL